ncbi:uncharacterized protein MELLADRAFT_123784 [Melampsora larici-populina 98AG31]|uniref:Secreted protein n=1 Tax=Melampsora larici-populina (strain 98AG31 / pathotype 3-4-7) TaxID=747676 RepID=F4RW81_MELLP|nr:uncharacterized protein MELLADRAFT_123784 [Melampsora larici-populina 98AG31]EGG03237.1 secreted protein [Melampsora larici-populina 98AG31]
MFHQSFFKIAMLFSILCFSALVESSLYCRGRFSKGAKTGEHKGKAACGTSHDNTIYYCDDDGCTNGGHRWVKMDHCVLAHSNWNGTSTQQCVEYKWDDNHHRFSCTNHGGVTYHCKMNIHQIQPIICSCYES